MNKTILFLLLSITTHILHAQNTFDRYGAMIRSDSLQKNIYLCFTGHDYDDGFEHVFQVLKRQNVMASFFLTGDFIRTHKQLVKCIAKDGHFVGAHSDKHLLYCDWNNRDSLLYSPEQIKMDIQNNLDALGDLGIYPAHFMPPYEWHNRNVVEIARELNQLTVNFTPGTKSNADYTTMDMPNYVSSKAILESILAYEKTKGLNGFHLLIHPGTSSLRKDKFYLYLDKLLSHLKNKGYQFSTF